MIALAFDDAVVRLNLDDHLLGVLGPRQLLERQPAA